MLLGKGIALLEGNVIFTMVLETEDTGCIHQWGRMPYLTDVNGQPGVFSLQPAQTRFTRNLILGNGRNFSFGKLGQRFAVETDDASSYLRFDHNVWG